MGIVKQAWKTAPEDFGVVDKIPMGINNSPLHKKISFDVSFQQWLSGNHFYCQIISNYPT